MRKLAFLSIAALVSLLVLFGCKKEVDSKAMESSLLKAAPSAPSISPTIEGPASGCLNQAFAVTFNLDQNISCGNIQIQWKSSSVQDWQNLVTNVQPVNGVYSVDFTPLMAENYEFRAKYNSTGQCAGTDISWIFSQMVVVEATCCETAFTGLALSCDETREAVYTFSVDEDADYFKMQGGLTNFTGDDAIVTLYINGQDVTNSGDFIIDQWTPGNSTNRVIRVQGGLDACESLDVHIAWNSSNGNEVITGSWSVKDQEGELYTPYLPGLTCTD